LVVCQAAEPFSLYPYATTMLVADNVRHAIYENLYTSLDYSYQPQGLLKLPNLADGDAQIVTVAVNEGDQVVNAAGEVVTLAAGTEIITADEQRALYDGQPLMMQQMVVDFSLRPMVWSDGTPVTAADSVYSFQLASDAAAVDTINVVNVEQVARTAAYEATGELTVRWTGLPGWLDPTYFLNVWSPLPQHHLGDIPPAQLGEHEASARRPLSSGPFVVTEWIPGESIHLARNPYYYRSHEGLPKVDEVTFRFLYDSEKLLAALLAGECHVGFKDGLQVDQATALQAAEADGLLIPYFTTGPTFEHLTFNVAPAAVGAMNWFADIRVRQALAMCTDRQQIINEVLFGVSQPLATYIPGDHPLYPADLITWPYDAVAANVLLDEAGYLDQDGDGLREAPATGTPFQITLMTTANNELRSKMAGLIRQNWAECGVGLESSSLPPEEFFAADQGGPLSGRHFDVALFSWLTDARPPCQLYKTAEIPHEREDGTTAGFNYGGWSNEAFDTACNAAQRAFVDSEAFISHHQEALRLFASELPAIPLYARVWVSAARSDVVGFMPDPTQPSELWNLFALDIDDIDQ
jgi:peptide/nickel transport system substrate-binding protein